MRHLKKFNTFRPIALKYVMMFLSYWWLINKFTITFVNILLLFEQNFNKLQCYLIFTLNIFLTLSVRRTFKLSFVWNVLTATKTNIVTQSSECQQKTISAHRWRLRRVWLGWQLSRLSTATSMPWWIFNAESPDH